MNELLLEASMERSVFLEGAADCRILIAKPQDANWALRTAEDANIRPSESVIIYLAVEFERYWAEGIRTFQAGDSHLVEPDIEDLKTLYENIMDMIKPGKKASVLFEEITAGLEQKNVCSISDYGFGQGVGLSLQEYPVIDREDETILSEGMCLTFRFAAKEKTLGAVMLGNTLFLSGGAPEHLIT